MYRKKSFYTYSSLNNIIKYDIIPQYSKIFMVITKPICIANKLIFYDSQTYLFQLFSYRYGIAVIANKKGSHSFLDSPFFSKAERHNTQKAINGTFVNSELFMCLGPGWTKSHLTVPKDYKHLDWLGISRTCRNRSDAHRCKQKKRPILCFYTAVTSAKYLS